MYAVADPKSLELELSEGTYVAPEGTIWAHDESFTAHLEQY